jgi:hypothetical protein
MKNLIILAILAGFIVPVYAGDLNFSKQEYKAQRDELYKSAKKMMEACYSENGLDVTDKCKQAIEGFNSELMPMGEDFYCNQC